MEIYGLCLRHKSKFQPMCHDMGSACYGCFWHSRRVCQVQIFCFENRILGMSKRGDMWLLPKDAEKPANTCRKNAEKKL